MHTNQPNSHPAPRPAPCEGESARVEIVRSESFPIGSVRWEVWVGGIFRGSFVRRSDADEAAHDAKMWRS